jgi:hypothetical protein
MNEATRTSAILALTWALVGCSTLEPYRVRETTTEYATIEATPMSLTNRFKYSDIVSLDRRRIDRKSYTVPENLDASGVPKRAIVIEQGSHKIHIMVCEFDMLFDKCAEAILSLEAEVGHRYLVGGGVSKSNEFADIWIDDMGSGEKVAGPLRVNGLYRR